MTQNLNVHFVNRGYGTDEGFKKVELLGQCICEHSGQASSRDPQPIWTRWFIGCRVCRTVRRLGLRFRLIGKLGVDKPYNDAIMYITIRE